MYETLYKAGGIKAGGQLLRSGLEECLLWALVVSRVTCVTLSSVYPVLLVLPVLHAKASFRPQRTTQCLKALRIDHADKPFPRIFTGMCDTFFFYPSASPRPYLVHGSAHRVLSACEISEWLEIRGSALAFEAELLTVLDVLDGEAEVLTILGVVEEEVDVLTMSGVPE